MNRQRNLALLTIVILVAVVSYMFGARQHSSAQGAKTTAGQAQNQSAALPLAGHLAPNFTLTDLQGRAITLSSLRGRPVFINFFASWCPPCKLETPDLVKMYHKYGKTVQFIGLNMTPGDTLAGVQNYVRVFGVPYPVLLDSNGTVESAYGVIDIPTSFFINSQGVIVSRVVGLMSQSEMQAKIAGLLRSR